MSATYATDQLKDVVMWLAFCSNKKRTPEECYERTLESLAKYGVVDPDNDASLYGTSITTASTNRGGRSGDVAFIKKLFEIDNKDIAAGCVSAMIGLYTQDAVSDQVAPMVDAYVARYGEDAEIATLKLRYLTTYPNYSSNVEEVERLMNFLAATEV